MKAAAKKLTVTTFDGLTDNKGRVQECDWERIVAKLTQHVVGPREGSLFCGAEFRGDRKRANVYARHLYILDVEPDKATGEIPPDVQTVIVAIKARGWAAIVYSTHNHTADAPRYRVVFVIEQPIVFDGDTAAIEADGVTTVGLAALIDLAGVTDRTKLCAESMFFFPRHGEGREYFAEYVDGRALNGDDLLLAVERGRALLADETTYTEAAADVPRTREGIIGAFNGAHSLVDLLAQYGYTRKPRSTVDFRSPHQTSESFATRVFDGVRWVSLSASDAAAGLGRPVAGGAARCGDAFDLYTAYEHGNDQRAAIKAAARLLGLDNKNTDDWADAATSPNLDAESETAAEKPALLRIRPLDTFAGEYEPASYLIDYMIQQGFLYSLTAETGAGKTALMILIASLVATGRPFGEAEVKRGHVIYCVGENADEFRQRIICLRESSFTPSEFDSIHVLTPEAHKGLLTASGAKEVAAYADRLGGVDLVVVDTAAAFFDGEEENDNHQLGEYARRLRRNLCTLPGRPTVVVCSHPTKNARTHDELVPRGGGAFVAEVDGNLTLCKRDVGRSELFWSKKFRGRIEKEIQIALTPVEAAKTVDAKGRPLRSVLASVTTEPTPVEQLNDQLRRDRICRLLLDDRGRSISEVAVAINEMMPGEAGGSENPGWKRTSREMKDMQAAGLLEVTDKRWRLSGRGKKHAKGLRPAVATADAIDTDDQF